jgi:hypothetical protein
MVSDLLRLLAYKVDAAVPETLWLLAPWLSSVKHCFMIR